MMGVVAGAAGSTASSGRFIPAMTIARAGLGLSAGQFKITDLTYNASYQYVLGGSASRSGQIVSLPAGTPAGTGAATQGTVRPFPPKGLTGGTVVNIARQPYTYHASYHHNPKCSSHWHSGQCAQWGPNNHHYNGEVKDNTPADYNDSEGEWWRIW